MEIMRLVVTGTVGAGKSTFIRSVSEIDVVDTDIRASDETALLKENTTVALDFGRLRFGSDMVLHLYGTPGQSRFDFMWDILIRRSHGYILLVPAHRPNEFRQARNILKFMKQRVQIPMIIGLTHTDCDGAWAEEDVFVALGYSDAKNRPPIVKVNATQRDSVAEALVVFIQHFMQNFVVEAER